MHVSPIIVDAFWDAEAGVFVATSNDVPGLITEATTTAELQAKLDVLIPELLELNSEHVDQFHDVPLVIRSEQTSTVRVPA